MSESNPSPVAAANTPAVQTQPEQKSPGTAPLNAPAQTGAARPTQPTSAKASRRQVRKQH
jgi:hypothetical protein